jgi:cation transporter-like permease
METFARTPLTLRLALLATSIIGLVLASIPASQWGHPTLGLAIVFGISCSANVSFAAFSIRPKRLRLSVKPDSIAFTAFAAAADSALGVALTVLHVVTVVNGQNQWEGISPLVMYASFFALVAWYVGSFANPCKRLTS